MQPLSWTTLEFEQKDRHPDWLWTVGLIFGLAAAVAFFYGNIFFGIFLVVAGTLTIAGAVRKPRELSVTLGETELLINDHLIEISRMKQFWIDETEKPDKLLLLVRGGFSPMTVLHLSGVTAETVRAAFTERKVPEGYMKESFGTRIAEQFGF